MPLPLSPMDLDPDDLPVAFGPFALESMLGEGAMGRVFRARRVDGPGHSVAVKVIAGDDTGEYRTALRKEIRLGELLDHPGIVRTLDHGETEGWPWLEMELVTGQPLDHVLDRHGKLPARGAVQLGAQVAVALAHAHAAVDRGEHANIVHRDLKPANVLLSYDGEARILDFGIAKAATLSGMTTAVGLTRGTPRYMSPEQTRGKPLDGRSDLFSLGTLLFELITGERLFPGRKIVEVMGDIVRADRTLERTGRLDLLQDVLPAAQPVIARCVRKKPEDRYASGNQLALDLLRVAERAPGPDLEQFASALCEQAATLLQAPALDSLEFESLDGDDLDALDASELLRPISFAPDDPHGD
jgi:serine/threonine protein kinase